LQEVQIKLSSTQEALTNAAAQSAASSGPPPTISARLRNPIRAALGRPLDVPAGRANMVKQLESKNQQISELSALNQVSAFLKILHVIFKLY
jgi:hypothetical protein